MEDDGTDTDTSSDSGNEVLNDSTRYQGMSEADISHSIYMQYRAAKKTWRRFTGKPVRSFRRGFKKFHKRGKGKGKGHSNRTFGKGRSWGRQ